MGVSAVTLPSDVLAAVENAIEGKVPYIARGTVQAPTTGWCQALYYDALTGAPMSFYDAPTVIAIAILRQGTAPIISAPTIKIPTISLPTIPSITVPSVELPAASVISIPTITLPTVPAITISKPSIPYVMKTFPTFVAASGIGQQVVQALCDLLNQLTNMLYYMQGDWNQAGPYYGGLNLAIYYVNQGLAAAYDTCQAIITEIGNLAGNTQSAINTYQANIQKSISDAMTSVQSNVQDAINSYQSTIANTINTALTNYTSLVQTTFNGYAANVEASVNAGLAQFISSLYAMIGLPYSSGTVQLLSPVQIQNVTKDGFQFYGLSAGMQISYVAIGRV